MITPFLKPITKNSEKIRILQNFHTIFKGFRERVEHAVHS